MTGLAGSGFGAGVVIGWSAIRLSEFLLSERNVGRLLAAGAFERCRSQHVPLLLANVAVAALAVLGRALPGQVPAGVSVTALVLLVAAEAVHWWAILTLPSRWTTGVLVIPGEAPCRRGPYRWLRHPGYVGGSLSGAMLPLAAGSWPASLAAGALLAAVVVLRVRCENEAWRSLGGRSA